MLNDSIHYQDEALYVDAAALVALAAQVGTPTYVYSLPRALANLERVRAAFNGLEVDLYYSVKANGNLSILRGLIDAGAGIDAVSAGEIYRALRAGAEPARIVFAGVGKTEAEIRYALESGVGWFNVENEAEFEQINALAMVAGRRAHVAPRLNPDVNADTHPHIATGHAAAKFGMAADVISRMLAHKDDFPALDFAGIHIHVGSQLHDTVATRTAVERALELIAPYPHVRTVNIGGGLPVAYQPDDDLPDWEAFAAAIMPLLKDYRVLVEPGRSIVADAGLLLVKVLYIKQQGGQTFVIVDGSMTELLRPALYNVQHQIVAVERHAGPEQTVQVVGPVCETSDILAHDVTLPPVQPGDLLAVLTTGAYGYAMSSNYNARPRPAEIVIEAGGEGWHVARKRESFADLINGEVT